MAVDKSLISGSTTMLILRLLEEKDMYGYEMIETLQEKSQNVFQLKAGTLYPLLHSLEEKGYVSSYEDSIGQKTRKYYSLTKNGKNFLSQKKEEWKEYIQKNQIKWAQLIDQKGWESTAILTYAIQGIPHLILLGPDGKIIANNPSEKQLSNILSNQLKQ